MNKLDEYIVNRMTQSKNNTSLYHQHQLLKWRILDKYVHGIPLNFEEKLDFIRFSLESNRISDTTIDILFRRMIRWTLPSWASFEILSKPCGNGHKVVASETTPGLLYTVTKFWCDCPGFLGHRHCKHHDDFVEELEAPSSLDENLTEEDYAGAEVHA